MEEEYNVYQFLERDLFKCNNARKKLKWRRRCGGGIGQIFGQYSLWEFNLEKSPYYYEIVQHFPKTFLEKLLSLFKKEESYYEIKAKIKEKSE